MQYAYVNGLKVEPIKGTEGVCLCCNNPVSAKCGNIKVHHWAHKSLKDCDTWYEPETIWHREWKNQFSADSREIVFKDPQTGEFHRADVHTSKGVTIEFQNSPISDSELLSRDRFYNKLVWVINGEKWQKNFELPCNIPDPNSPDLAEYEFEKSRHIIFFRKGDEGRRLYSLASPELRHVKPSTLHFNFEWKHEHKTWFLSSSPIFIDFGSDSLYWLKRKKQTKVDYWYIKVVEKKEFIDHYG